MTITAIEKPLVSTDWLNDHLGTNGIRIIDASWRMPHLNQEPANEVYLKRHIPGAVFFDLDAIADHAVALPHMAPPRGEFEKAMGDFGISNTDHVIVYDDNGIFSAARVWWTFIAMGHRSVSVLDGGLPKWLAEKRVLQNSIDQFPHQVYKTNPVCGAFIDADGVRAALASGALVLDARPAPRFFGEAAEPRAHLRRGHMPGARNLPFGELLDAVQTLKSPATLREIFAEYGITAETDPIITTCGSGVTAAIINLALAVAQLPLPGLYDGSWADWGEKDRDPLLFPVATGT